MICEQYLNNRTLNLRVEGPCIILTEEAPLWLAPVSQENFEKYALARMGKNSFFLCALAKIYSAKKWAPAPPPLWCRPLNYIKHTNC